MKIITALVQPFMLSKVTHALEEIDGFPGMTVSDVRGFGREKSTHDARAPHRVIEDFVEYVKKARIEVVAHDDMVEQIVETIVRVAHTGNRGDGKVFVWSVERAVRIMTGETDDRAV
ncbi:MAG TPA: P-II family nitrogen regulator [Pyrinomonadaceae bacterium]|nr:P-II family nitrogen regulator [Pyrinomonadaceae bacterium]